jgi:hypothetical protein
MRPIGQYVSTCGQDGHDQSQDGHGKIDHEHTKIHGDHGKSHGLHDLSHEVHVPSHAHRDFLHGATRFPPVRKFTVKGEKLSLQFES